MLEELGIAGLIGLFLLIIIFTILIPIVATLIVGVAIANMLGFTGITWWAFMIVFYLIVASLMSLGASKVKR